VPTSDKFCGQARFLNQKLALHSRIIFASPEVVHTSGSNSLLYFDPQNIYQIRRQKWNASARRLPPADVFECWPQVCRVKVTFTLLVTNHYVSTTMNLMKCRVSWIAVRIRVRSRNTQLHIKSGPEPLENEMNKFLGSKRENQFSARESFFGSGTKYLLGSCFVLFWFNNFLKAPWDMQNFPQMC